MVPVVGRTDSELYKGTPRCHDISASFQLLFRSLIVDMYACDGWIRGISF